MKLWVLLAWCCLLAKAAFGAFPNLHLQPVVLQQLHAPTCITNAGDGSGRLFVVDQAGQIWIIKAGMLMPEPFLDISSTASEPADRKVVPMFVDYSERGLLSLAFHPGYADPASPGYRRFYVNYTKPYQPDIDPPWPVQPPLPDCTTVVAEFRVSANDPDRADPTSERRLLMFVQPQRNHNGGGLVFDGAGLLYIGSGDGGGANDNNAGHTGGFEAIPATETTPAIPRPTDALGNGQDRTVLLGKILRIDPLDPDGEGPLEYGIPPSNPFVGEGGGVKEEIYAYGIRNPWGLTFDDGPGGTGRLFCADVGQGRIEEVNLIVSGGNYGWRYKEGRELPAFSSSAPQNPMPHPGGVLIDPIVEYGHPGMTGSSLPLLGLSITGGYVYRGTAIPALQGKYVFGDYGATRGGAGGRMMGLEETTVGSGEFVLTEALPILGGNPLSFRVMCLGRDEAGELYVGTKSTGEVLALENGLPNGGIYQIVAEPTNPPPVVLTAVKDNSIFSDTGMGGAELSNGLGSLWVGRTPTADGDHLRRGLLQFDLTGLPSGQRWSSAMLRLHLDEAAAAPAASRATTLHRVDTGWGEAGSFSAVGGAVAQAGDATWTQRLFSVSAPLFWDNPEGGGDYQEAISARFGLNQQTGSRGFQGPQLVKDVHDWQAMPGANHGWLIRSDEGAAGTVKRLASREESDPAKWPTLILVSANHFESWASRHFPNYRVGQWIAPDGDEDGDGLGNLLEYAYGLNPMQWQAEKGLETSVESGVAGVREVTTTFLRDAAATELRYRLERSGDGNGWTAIAESRNGAAAAAAGGAQILSETVVEGTVRRVSVKFSVGPEQSERSFVRLVVERQ
jgi:glucose/arabinose dehydrogenase